MERNIKISPRMRAVADYLIEHCEGIHFCVKEKDGNLYVAGKDNRGKARVAELGQRRRT